MTQEITDNSGYDCGNSGSLNDRPGSGLQTSLSHSSPSGDLQNVIDYRTKVGVGRCELFRYKI